MIDWILDNDFLLSINFHDGAVVANYPWDDRNMRKQLIFIQSLLLHHSRENWVNLILLLHHSR